VSIGQENYTIEGRLILCCEVCAVNDVQILYSNDSYDRYAVHFGSYSLSFPEVAIVSEVV
jgi:hypothetical protein